MNKIDITKEIYSSAVAGDWEKFKQYIHPDFAVIESAALPYGGEYRGLQGFQELVRKVFTFFDRLSVEAVQYMEGDNYVVAIVSLQGKGKKTGRDFESDLLELFRFEGDKVIEIKPYYWDQLLINEI